MDYPNTLPDELKHLQHPAANMMMEVINNFNADKNHGIELFHHYYFKHWRYIVRCDCCGQCWDDCCCWCPQCGGHYNECYGECGDTYDNSDDDDDDNDDNWF